MSIFLAVVAVDAMIGSNVVVVQLAIGVAIPHEGRWAARVSDTALHPLDDHGALSVMLIGRGLVDGLVAAESTLVRVCCVTSDPRSGLNRWQLRGR